MRKNHACGFQVISRRTRCLVSLVAVAKYRHVGQVLRMGGADTGGDGVTVFWRGMVGMCWRGVLKMGGSQRRERLSPAERARLRAFHCLSSELFSRSLVYQRKMTRMQQMAFPQRSTPVQVQKEKRPTQRTGGAPACPPVAVLLASLTDGLPTMPFVKMPPPQQTCPHADFSPPAFSW